MLIAIMILIYSNIDSVYSIYTSFVIRTKVNWIMTLERMSNTNTFLSNFVSFFSHKWEISSIERDVL